MQVIDTNLATDIICDYFNQICDTDYPFDETEILRRMNAKSIDLKYIKTGRWILEETPLGINDCRCSECLTRVPEPRVYTFAYCPYCGAKMEG